SVWSRWFQFPSNGKAYPKYKFDNPSYILYKFQFPSNGKAYPKKGGWINSDRCCYVSIPFKRESVSKDRENASPQGLVSCFNSLQS
ncbi:MAG: hypothetical protein OXU23_02520, partial [Candidatus Poribacteria bacterium]|nr:hypothetical protein [Candidatus Poribacteria bacterium]